MEDKLAKIKEMFGQAGAELNEGLGKLRDDFTGMEKLSKEAKLKAEQSKWTRSCLSGLIAHWPTPPPYDEVTTDAIYAQAELMGSRMMKAQKGVGRD